MDNLHEAPADFVSHWGLRFDPFAPEAEVPFFPGENYVLALDQLEHYCRYGNLLLVVTAPSGAGKTILRKAFVQRFGHEAEICALLAHPLHTTAQILNEVSQSFGLVRQDGDDLESFAQQLALADRRVNRVLVIDDADTLDASVVSSLVALAAQWRDQPEPPLRLVLFGEPHLTAMLAQSGVSATSDEVHVINLPPLALEETADYLQHRLAAAGFDKELPLGRAQLEALHKAGHGLPASINRQAGHFLTELLDIASALEEEPVTLTPALKKSLIGVAAILVLGILLFQLPKLFEEDSQPSKPAGSPVVNNSNRIPLNPVPETAEAMSATAASQEPRTEHAVQSLDSSELAAAPGQSPEPLALAEQATAPAPETPVVDKPEPSAEVSPAESGAGNETGQPADAKASPVSGPAKTPTLPAPTPAKPSTSDKAKSGVATRKAPSKPVATTHAVASHAKPGLHGDEHLKTANPKAYTVQIVGLSERSKLTAYIQRHRLGGDLYIYRTERAGKPLYILVQGIYPSRNAALAAAQRLTGLPEKPWAKPIAAVQKDLAGH